MRMQSYRRTIDIPSGNVRDMSRGLLVNCAGVCALSKPFVTDTQRQDHYLLVLWKGNLHAWTDEGEVTMCPGDVITFPPDTPYRYAMGEGGDITYYWVHFTGSDAHALLHHAGFAPCRVYHAGLSEDLSVCYHRLFQCFLRTDSFSAWEAAAHLSSILALLKKEIDERLAAPDKKDTARMRDVLAYLYVHFAGPVTIGDLAAIAHLSGSRLQAVFRAHTGVSPQHFLIHLRVQSAIDWLLRTDLDVQQIAPMVGYTDSFYFSRLFKRKTGMSPTEYRRARRGG